LVISACANSSQDEINNLFEKYDALVEAIKMQGILDDFQAIKDIVSKIKRQSV
jgi:hypothetical protein